MKLVFPNGEHPQVLLSHGVNRIGSAGEGAVVLQAEGVVAHHCEIHVTTTGANLQVPGDGGPVSVNGKPVADIMALRAGDMIGIGPVQARFAIVEAARSAPAAAGGSAANEDGDNGATRVRMAVPKFVLRGVSGAVFGKVIEQWVEGGAAEGGHGGESISPADTPRQAASQTRKIAALTMELVCAPFLPLFC